MLVLKNLPLFFNAAVFFFLGIFFHSLFTEEVPSFNDFQVEQQYRVQKDQALLISLKSFPKNLSFKEKEKILYLISQKKVNFGGEFILFDIDIDLFTKRIELYSLKEKRFLKNHQLEEVFLPRIYKNRFAEQFFFEYYAESKLLKVSGLPIHQEKSGIYYYVFDEGEFKKEAFFPWEKD